ncbi:MAG: Omp28-related outer membrane protein [candidate division WOR-3 bacterium]|nr:MAG: Omp28-related outer membrane protein [candidate division WOR-3 bacterium]
MASGTLAQIALDHPGRVAAVDVHFSPTDSFYLEEAYQRMHYYPPPFSGNYLPPWLWYDGDQHGSYDYLLWESYITVRMSEPAPVTVTMSGYYNPAGGTGSVYAQFRNDSSAAITGRVIIVITEDSLYYPAPNGALWHNHVPRDYLPDHNGEIVNIDPGDSVTVTRSFSIEPFWDDTHCRILAWIQNDEMQPDSTKEIWQGGMLEVDALGVEEHTVETAASEKLQVLPNPCRSEARCYFTLPQGVDYQIALFDATGRLVRSINGSGTGKQETVVWQRDDKWSIPVRSGVYFYRFTSECIQASGKIVVQ